MAGNGKNPKDWRDSNTLLAMVVLLAIGLMFAGAWWLGYEFREVWGMPLLFPAMPAMRISI